MSPSRVRRSSAYEFRDSRLPKLGFESRRRNGGFASILVFRLGVFSLGHILEQRERADDAALIIADRSTVGTQKTILSDPVEWQSSQNR